MREASPCDASSLRKKQMPSPEWLSRELPLVGEDGIEKLENASVLLVGAGGVGGYALEALVRAGVGKITVVDGDTVDITNLNRQLISLRENVGKLKADEAVRRVLSVNPGCRAVSVPRFINSENAEEIISSASPDFIVDACDDTDAKLLLALWAENHSVGIISCMGTGNKLDPSLLRIEDISKTSICPLAKSMRKKLRDAGVTKLPVVFSTETPAVRGTTPASVSFVPAAAGILMASYVVRKIISSQNH